MRICYCFWNRLRAYWQIANCDQAEKLSQNRIKTVPQLGLPACRAGSSQQSGALVGIWTSATLNFSFHYRAMWFCGKTLVPVVVGARALDKSSSSVLLWVAAAFRAAAAALRSSKQSRTTLTVDSRSFTGTSRPQFLSLSPGSHHRLHPKSWLGAADAQAP